MRVIMQYSPRAAQLPKGLHYRPMSTGCIDIITLTAILPAKVRSISMDCHIARQNLQYCPLDIMAIIWYY